MTNDKRSNEHIYPTDPPTPMRTVDKLPREFTPDHERALEALQRVVNTNDDTALMPAPHVG